MLQFEKMRRRIHGIPAPRSIATTPAASTGKGILYVNTKQQACGVYQMGRRVHEALASHQKHYHFHLAECESSNDVMVAARACGPSAVIFNYHPMTMPFVGHKLIADLEVPCIGFFHDITPALLRRPWPPYPFSHWIHADPSALDDCPFMFKTVRPVFNYVNRFPVPTVPTIGTFGFGTPHKGFQRLAVFVQNQFDAAVLRMHIPFSAIGDADGRAARGQADAVRRLITKPGIRVDVSHHMMSNSDLLDFLGQNTINAFLYDQQLSNSGISSTIDYAISSGSAHRDNA